MRGRLLRSLALAGSLVLALPQGWCCMVAIWPSKTAPLTQGQEPAAPVEAGACCPCCGHQAAPPCGSPGTTGPTDKPSAPLKGTCCCSDRHATRPPSFSLEQADAKVRAALPPLVSVPPASTASGGAAIAVTHPPTYHPRVLNCVWLC
jgi:hypothetical protein